MATRHKPRRVSPARAERINKVLALRQSGAPFRDIANSLGVSVSRVHDDYRDGIRLTFQDNADELRKLELARLDRMQQAVWNQALRGDTDAIRTLLQIMARRAIYTGINEPPTENDVSAVKSLLEQLIEEKDT